MQNHPFYGQPVKIISTQQYGFIIGSRNGFLWVKIILNNKCGYDYKPYRMYQLQFIVLPSMKMKAKEIPMRKKYVKYIYQRLLNEYSLFEIPNIENKLEQLCRVAELL